MEMYTDRMCTHEICTHEMVEWCDIDLAICTNELF